MPGSTLKSERTSYTALDFRAFQDAGTLELTPKFQRREVWSNPAKAFFIDSILRGFPIPPIYLRVGQSSDRARTTREVVDGQQRIKALLGFLNDDFPLPRTSEIEWAGKYFSRLSEGDQDRISGYSLICEALYGVSDAQILAIFARLNTYSVSLNAQELRNGTYFGQFKESAYSLALEHIEYWRRHKIFTENSIARMLEVELTSELMVLPLAGLQDKKKSLNLFYQEYDESFPKRSTVEKRLRATLDVIADSLGESLRTSEFRRTPLFYSLFAAVYHRTFGVPGVNLKTPKRILNRGERQTLAVAVDELTSILRLAREEKLVPDRYQSFVVAASRQTDNLQPRRTQLTTIYRVAFGR